MILMNMEVYMMELMVATRLPAFIALSIGTYNIIINNIFEPYKGRIILTYSPSSWCLIDFFPNNEDFRKSDINLIK